MAKRSRGRVTREPATPATSSQRAQRTRTPRRTTRRPAQQPFFERYRSLIIGGIALVGVLIIGFLFFQGATGSAYACRTLLTPGPSEPVPTPRPATPTPSLTASPSAGTSPTAAASPTDGTSPSPTSGESPSASPSASESPSAAPSPTAEPSPSASATPAPSPTARLGFTTTDLGQFHVVDPGATITYDYCPPASGEHYNIANVAPMPPDAYPPAQERSPGFWVHNLEHGYTVVLYRCPSGQLGVGDCISQAEYDQLEQFVEQAPAPEVSACPRKALVVRFDEMNTKFSVLAWDRALLMDEFDLDTAVTFAEQWTEHVGVPEPLAC